MLQYLNINLFKKTIENNYYVPSHDMYNNQNTKLKLTLADTYEQEVHYNIDEYNNKKGTQTFSINFDYHGSPEFDQHFLEITFFFRYL